MVKTNVQPGARLLGLAAALLMLLGLAGCGVQITSAALPQSATLEKGDTVQMEVDFGTENQAEAEAIAKAAEKLDLTWTSSDEAVAVVTTKVEAITLDNTEGVLTVGNTHKINASVTPENATDLTVTWTSSDNDIATVDADGNVKAVTAGNATITASAGNVSATYALTVKNITCSYCGGTGHTSSNCSVKAADQKAAAQQQQAAAQAAQQQQAAAQQPAANTNNNTDGGSTSPAPAPSTDNNSGSTSNPAPSGGTSDPPVGSSGFDPVNGSWSVTESHDWTQDSSNGDNPTIGKKG